MVSALRRVKQLGFLLLHPAYRSPETAMRLSQRRYETPREVEHYKTLEGLFPEELSILTAMAPAGRALVVGCGGGREARALLNQFRLNVTAIDTSLEMIDAARRQGGAIDYQAVSLENFGAGKFNLIFVSAAIVEHLQGRKRRERFYAKLRECLEPEGSIYLSPEIRALDWRSQFYWASKILKVHWREEWEPGDSARSFFGRHNDEAQPVYYHFYPSEEAFAVEIHQASLETVKRHEGGLWLRGVSQ